MKTKYIDGLTKAEILSQSIVYDNGGESYDRYTIFTPDGSVFGMSEDAKGFNQFLGDHSEIEEGEHLGKKLKSVPKAIQNAVLNRMVDDEMYEEGGVTNFNRNNLDKYVLDELQGNTPSMGVKIARMKEILQSMFPDSFGFKLYPIQDVRFLVPNIDNFYGVDDSELKIAFDATHAMDFRVFQGDENTYFYFILNGSDGKQYIGDFGFKDRGEVPKAYLTSFVAFLMKVYGNPFSIAHSVFEGGGEVDDDDLIEDDDNEYAKGGKVASIGDSGIITDKNSMHIGKMATISGDLGNMYEVFVIGNSGQKVTTIVKKNGINIISDEYAEGGRFGGGNDFLKKWDVIREQVRFAFAKVLGIDRAIDILDRKYGVSPYNLVERAVYSDLLLINEIDEDLIDSAINEAEDSNQMEEIGSSDQTYLIKYMLDGAGLKTDFVNNRLERVDANGNVITLKNELPSSTMFAKGGMISEIKSNYSIAGNDEGGVWTYSKRTADDIASKYNGSVQEDGSKWYVSLNKMAKGGQTTESAIKILMTEEPKVWDKFGFDSGGEIRESKDKTRKYAEELEKVLSQKGISRGSLTKNVYDELEDENYHLLNEFLGRNGYFKKDFNNSLTERYESPKYSKYYSDKESITVAPSTASTSKKTAREILMEEEPKVWDKFGFESGSEIRASKEKTKKYAQELERVFSKEGIKKGTLTKQINEDLEDENYHLLNEFLVRNGYFKKDLNDSLLKSYENPIYAGAYADKESITISSSTPSAPKKTSSKKIQRKKLSAKTTYVPRRDIKSVELKNSKSIPASDIVDGVYKKK